jgi:GNAT superfamily N-acetyltransferase
MCLIRLMQVTDIPALLVIQEQAYGVEMFEDAEVIEQRLHIAPETAWVAETDAGVQAYLVTYPSRLGALTALGDNFQCAADADCLYLHDLAVATAAGGCGLGQALIAAATRYAEEKGYGFSSLISVQNSVGFWQRRGYGVVENLNPAQQLLLATYTGPAYYMSKTIAVSEDTAEAVC